jgi:p24 family protein alpha
MHFLLPLLFLPFSNALYFYLNAGQSRCFLEELPKDTIVVGHYKAEDWDEERREFVIRDNIGIQISVTVSLMKKNRMQIFVYHRKVGDK